MPSVIHPDDLHKYTVVESRIYDHFNSSQGFFTFLVFLYATTQFGHEP